MLSSIRTKMVLLQVLLIGALFLSPNQARAITAGEQGRESTRVKTRGELTDLEVGNGCIHYESLKYRAAVLTLNEEANKRLYFIYRTLGERAGAFNRCQAELRKVEDSLTTLCKCREADEVCRDIKALLPIAQKSCAAHPPALGAPRGARH